MTNRERLAQIIQSSKATIGGYPAPSIIELSPSNYCNLKCFFCPKSLPSYSNSSLFMDSSLIERVCDDLEAFHFDGLVILAGFGEPLCHPSLPEIVRRISRVAKVDVITNGVLLNNSYRDDLIDCGVNKILVSAYTKEIERKTQLLFSDTPEEKYEIRPRYCEFETTNRGGMMNKNIAKNPCYYLLYEMVIDWNGDVMLCVQDFNRMQRFGNVMFDSIKRIWLSKEFMEYRRTLIHGRTKYPCCVCDVKGTLQGKELVERWLL